MNFLFTFIFIFFTFTNLNARNIGETEITTEEGIEVFQNEKYYLLKKNVKIISDDFVLQGDQIKIFFNKDLYDIEVIDANGNVTLKSEVYNVDASGDKLFFKVENEEVNIKGSKSKLITNETDMRSDGEINVNNKKGNFYIIGPNSTLKSEDIFIEGNSIDGIFSNVEGKKTVSLLNVNDDNIAFIKTDNTQMYSNIVKYNKKTSLIELENNVKIIRDGETITGDYGALDTKNNSYKIKSKDTKKVKVIIINQDE